MELYELKYFLAVADEESVQRAAKNIAISPGSLSKAIARLEEELDVSLFERIGRGLKLSEHGALLRIRARELLDRASQLKTDVAGFEGRLRLIISGPEILLTEFGPEIARVMQAQRKNAAIEFRSRVDADAIKDVESGASHLALTTESVSQLTSKVIADVMFETCVGKRHPLFRRSAKKTAIPVEEVLAHGFVSPSLPILGQVGQHQAVDGWRDDKFPRRIDYKSTSVKLIETLVMQGNAVAYLPAYFVNHMGAEVLQVTGCPYTCKQKVRLVSKRHRELTWLRDVFDQSGNK